MLGKDYVLTINGNPVAAQALNGLTNPDTADNILFNTLAKTMRWMSMMFTQKNPAFLISNLSRDAFFANSMVRRKEGKGYSFEVLRAKILYRNTGKLRPKFDKNMGFVKFKKNVTPRKAK